METVELPLNMVIEGDCLQVMKGFPDNSVDLVLTDPPYGISFMNKDWDRALPPKEAFAEMFRVLKPGALAFVMSSPRQDVLWRMLALLEGVGFNLRQSFVSWIYKSGFPKAYDVSKGIDRKFGLKRNKKKYDVSEVGNFKARQDSRPFIEEAKDQGYHETVDDQPLSDLAKKWVGWKSIAGLKPALECVLMVNKPLSERTIVDNVLRWGCGAVNVDAGRIPFQDEEDVWKPHFDDKGGQSSYIIKGQRQGGSERGRFPANLLVSDGALDTGKITKSTGGINDTLKIFDKKFKKMVRKGAGGYKDIGDQSRYFDLDAWARHYGFLDVPKAGKAERDKGLIDFEQKSVQPAGLIGLINQGKEKPRQPRRNFHPTVKPVKLGCYLVELACQPGGVVLDPFCGSGSFCISAKISGRRYIGIDVDGEACGIARARLEAYGFQPRLEAFDDG